MDPFNQVELKEQVRAVMVEALQVSPDEISSTLAFGDIPQWDSIGHMELMMLLESRFGVEITTDTITELVSIPAICDYLARKEAG